MKRRVTDYILISVGVAVAVAGLNLFLVPNKIAAGGVSGIATILYHLLGLPLGLSIAVLNIPLFIIGFRMVGKSFALRTLYALVLYSVLAEVIPVLKSEDMFLGCVYGGLLVGAGVGVVIRAGGSTGGTDMAAKMLSARFKSIGIGSFIFGIDFVVIAAAGAVFEPMAALYAFASLYITTKLIDLMTVGLAASKAFYIISERNSEISRVIMEELGRGVTALTARGLYSGQQREVLLCVLRWYTEGAKLKRIVKSIDEKAFVIVADVKEVLGEGF